MARTKFIHLTDTHLPAGGARLYGADPAARLAAAIDSINREHADAAFIALTGDVTHWGEPDAFDALAGLLARAAPPVHVILGNHDDRVLYRAAFPGGFLDADGFVQTVVDTPAGPCVFLDTNEAGESAGRFCPARRQWLAQALDAIPGRFFVFMHHPPCDTGIASMDAIGLRDADAFADVLAPHMTRLRHIFFGHVHRPIFGSWRGVSFSCMRGLNHQVALDLGGAAGPIAANLEPPAYGVALVDDDSVVVHLHEFMDRSPRFSLSPPAGVSGRDHALMMRHDSMDD